MAKLYKVRKKCLICGKVFYPKYAGSLYCDECKSRKSSSKKSSKKTTKKKSSKKTAKKKSKIKFFL